MGSVYVPQATDWIGALEAGQKARMVDDKQKLGRQIGGLMASGDYKGAANAAYSNGELDTGVALTKTGAAQAEQQRRQGYGAKYAAGQGKDAVQAAYAGGDFEIGKDLQTAIDSASAEQQKLAHEHASRTAEIVAPLGEIPETDMAARKAYLQQHKPELVQAGLYTPEQIDGFDPTDANLAVVYSQALGVKDYLEQKKGVVIGMNLVNPNTGKTMYEGPRYEKVGQGEQLLQVGGAGSGPAPNASPTPGTVAPPGDRGSSEAPRGLRNNNPLNLEASVRWAGMTGNDGRYATFSDPAAGWAAADRNLQSYASKHGIETVAGIINRWAPPSENDSGAYAATVAKAIGVDPNARLDLSNQSVRRAVLEAMAGVENGRPVAWGQGGAAGAPSATAARPQPAPPTGPNVRVIATGTPKPGFRAATAAEKAAYNIAPDVPAQVGPDGKIDVITGTGAALKPVPPKVQGGYIANRTSMKQIDDAIAEIQNNPKALGLKNAAGDTITQRMDPGGVTPRASVANIGSLIIHDRSGAAVTAAETPRLLPFIPSVMDTPETAIKKLQGLRHQLENAQSEIEVQYGEDSGYRAMGGQGAAQRADTVPAAKPAPKPATPAKPKAPHQMSDAEIKASLGLQ